MGGPRGARPPAGHAASRAGTRAALAKLVADLRALQRARPRAARGRGAVRVPARHRLARRARRCHDRARPRRRSRTSPASSTSSAPVGAARRTIGPSSSPATSQTLIEAGDDPPTADLDPDVDAVAVLTVHKAKGLEFPVVFLPGLVDGRFPARSRREPLALPIELVDEVLPEGDGHLQEERRLFYVGMTRARDELILSHAADYGGRRARRVSPFVARGAGPADRGASRHGVAAPRPRGLERLAAAIGGRAGPAAACRADRPPIEGPLIAELLPGRRLPDLPAEVQVRPRPACPDRAPPLDRLRRGAAPGGPGVPPRQARGEVMTEAELLRRRSTRPGRTRASCRASTRWRGSRPAGRRCAGSARSSSSPGRSSRPTWSASSRSRLDGDRIRGRLDRVDIEPAAGHRRVRRRARAKSPSGSLRADVDRADAGRSCPGSGHDHGLQVERRARPRQGPPAARADSLQLQIYAMAYEAMTGRLPDAVQLHFLESGLVGRAEVGRQAAGQRPRARSRGAAAGIRARRLHAQAGLLACTYCPFRDICPSSAAR